MQNKIKFLDESNISFKIENSMLEVYDQYDELIGSQPLPIPYDENMSGDEIYQKAEECGYDIDDMISDIVKKAVEDTKQYDFWLSDDVVIFYSPSKQCCTSEPYEGVFAKLKEIYTAEKKNFDLGVDNVETENLDCPIEDNETSLIKDVEEEKEELPVDEKITIAKEEIVPEPETEVVPEEVEEVVEEIKLPTPMPKPKAPQPKQEEKKHNEPQKQNNMPQPKQNQNNQPKQEEKKHNEPQKQNNMPQPKQNQNNQPKQEEKKHGEPQKQNNMPQPKQNQNNQPKQEEKKHGEPQKQNNMPQPKQNENNQVKVANAENREITFCVPTDSKKMNEFKDAINAIATYNAKNSDRKIGEVANMVVQLIEQKNINPSNANEKDLVYDLALNNVTIIEGLSPVRAGIYKAMLLKELKNLGF